MSNLLNLGGILMRGMLNSKHNIVRSICPILALTIWFPAAFAQYDDPAILLMEEASGKVIASYSVEELKNAFPIHKRETSTPWTPKGEIITFRGPCLEDLVEKYFPFEKSIEVVAYNGFSSIIKRNEIEEYEPILAVERLCDDKDRMGGFCTDGQLYRPLDLKDGGPLFLVWPLDQLPTSYIPARNAIWVWFVVSVRPSNE